jgi:hypothetical protein
MIFTKSEPQRVTFSSNSSKRKDLPPSISQPNNIYAKHNFTHQALQSILTVTPSTINMLFNAMTAGFALLITATLSVSCSSFHLKLIIQSANILGTFFRPLVQLPLSTL